MKLTREMMAKLLGVAGSIYDKKITDELIDAYYSLLEKHDAEKVRNAFTRCFERNLDFPKPATLLHIISPKADLS